MPLRVPSVLVVAPEGAPVAALTDAFAADGWLVRRAAPDAAAPFAGPVDVLVTGPHGAALARAGSLSEHRGPAVIVVDTASMADMREAFRAGAFDVLPTPLEPAAVVAAARRALAERLRTTEHARLQQRFDDDARLAALAKVTAGLAHELNNPLAIVIAALAATERDLARLEHVVPPAGAPALASVRTAIDDASEAGRRISEQVRRLRQLSHGTSGAVDVTLARVLDEARRRFEVRLGSGASVDWRLESDAAVRLPGGAARLVQILVDLVATALVASRDRPDAQVRCVLAWRADELTVTVDGADHPQPAAREPTADLALLREMLGLLGGDVQVDSAPGRGTRVRARIPALRAEPRLDA